MAEEQACRDVIFELWAENPDGGGLSGASNSALIRDRYLKIPVKSDNNLYPKAREELFITMQHAQDRSYKVYNAVFNRYKSSIPRPLKAGLFRTKGRMIIGLGSENVLETGVTLNHTYGTPFIPGTALKGLASHYCNLVWGAADLRYKSNGEYHTAIFGTTDDSGHFTFHDGWIVPDSLEGSLRKDVMTPHHGEYYSGNNEPTDFDDPNPVTFLSIVGTFHIAVSCDIQGDLGKKWNNLVFGMLSDALLEWGIGGKTSSGYGRLIPEGVKPDGEISNDGSDTTDNKSITGKKPYIKGKIIRVRRIEDHINKRGKTRLYFIADDGVKGFVEHGDASTVEIGESCKMIVVSYLIGDNRYSFAVPGAWSPNSGENERKGERRR